MRGNPRNQSGQIFRSISKIGASRHQAKKQVRGAGITGSHAIALNVGVFSFSTIRRYRQITAAFLQFCRDEYNLNDAERIEPEHIEHYLHVKISEGVRYSTFVTHCAALNKASAGLSAIYKRNYDWSDAIDRTRTQAREYLDRNFKSRGFRDPKSVIDCMTGSSRVCAELQLHGGARSGEICHLTEKNMIGDCRILLTNTKGGRRRIMRVPQQLYDQVADIVRCEGTFTVNYHRYLADIRSACTATGQHYTGSHDFRHCFAQRTVAVEQLNGRGYEEALSIVARRLGHSRCVVTLHYCR